jgi:predicted transcriptional regulator
LNFYPERTLIAKKDLQAYANGREEKKALVLEFINFMKYESPVKL